MQDILFWVCFQDNFLLNLVYLVDFAHFDLNHIELNHNILITFISLISKFTLITYILITMILITFTLFLINNISKASEWKQDVLAEKGGMIKVK